MYYKVLKDNCVIDVLEQIIYVKWQPKHKIMVLTDINDAQGILSSDCEHVWHDSTLYRFPDDVDGYTNVKLEEIDEFEYEKLRTLGLKDPQDIFDQAVLLTMQKFLGGV